MTNLATMNDRRAGADRGRQRDTVAVSPRAVPRQRGRQRDTVVVSPAPRSRVRGVLVAGMVTSVWNCLVVATPVLVAVITVWWIAGRPGAVATVVKAAGAVWLVGHGVPVGVAGLTVGLPALALTVIILWRLSKAGANTIRAIGGRDVPAVRAATLSVVIGYTLTTFLIAFLVDGSGFTVTLWRAAAHAAVLALLGASLGALSESGCGTALWHRLPVWWRRGLRTGALSIMATVAAGALLTGVAIAVRGSSVAETITVYNGGALGLAILSLLYIPTLALWATAYILGPGFAVGDGTHVSVMEVVLGPLPQFPLFAATPAEPLDVWGTALWGVPLAIGSIQGVLLALRSVDIAIPRLIYATIVSGVTAGVVTLGLMYAASGSLGQQHLSVMGPRVLSTAATAAGVVAGSVFVGAMATRLLGAKRARD